MRLALDDLGRRTSLVQRCRRHEDCHEVHPLLVRHLGARRSGTAKIRLHRRAAAWYAGADRPVDAAVHFAAAGKWADAAAAFVTGRAFAHPYGGRVRAACCRSSPTCHPTRPARSPPSCSPPSRSRGATPRPRPAKQLGRAEELVEDPPPGRGAGLALALAVVGAGVARLTADAGQALAARDGLGSSRHGTGGRGHPAQRRDQGLGPGRDRRSVAGRGAAGRGGDRPGGGGGRGTPGSRRDPVGGDCPAGPGRGPARPAHPGPGAGRVGGPVTGRPGPGGRPGRASSSGRGRATTRPIVVEPLTARESEVLAYLSALLSTEEIAALMFVSVNTVKSHVRGILRKLGAPRRNEAVRRARELQLI